MWSFLFPIKVVLSFDVSCNCNWVKLSSRYAFFPFLFFFFHLIDHVLKYHYVDLAITPTKYWQQSFIQNPIKPKMQHWNTLHHFKIIKFSNKLSFIASFIHYNTNSQNPFKKIACTKEHNNQDTTNTLIKPIN